MIRLSYLLPLALLTFPLAVQAQQVDDNFQAQATVARSCTIVQTQDLNFGQYDPVTANTSGQHISVDSGVLIKCTAGMTGVKLSLGKGLNPNASFGCNSPQRFVVGPNGDKIRYHFYRYQRDGGMFWGCSMQGGVRVGDGMTETINTFTDSLTPKQVQFTSLLIGGQDVRAGIYTDTINVGVIF